MCHTIETSDNTGRVAKEGHSLTWHEKFDGATFPGLKAQSGAAAAFTPGIDAEKSRFLKQIDE